MKLTGIRRAGNERTLPYRPVLYLRTVAAVKISASSFEGSATIRLVFINEDLASFLHVGGDQTMITGNLFDIHFAPGKSAKCHWNLHGRRKSGHQHIGSGTRQRKHSISSVWSSCSIDFLVGVGAPVRGGAVIVVAPNAAKMRQTPDGVLYRSGADKLARTSKVPARLRDNHGLKERPWCFSCGSPSQEVAGKSAAPLMADDQFCRWKCFDHPPSLMPLKSFRPWSMMFRILAIEASKPTVEILVVKLMPIVCSRSNYSLQLWKHESRSTLSHGSQHGFRGYRSTFGRA